MTMTSAELLDRGLAELGLDLPAETRAKLLAYAALIAKWNKVYNLTAIRSEAEIVTLHLLDSLTVLPHIDVTPDRRHRFGGRSARYRSGHRSTRA